MAALLVFIAAYGFVIAEEFTNLRKSKPVILAAGVIWILVAVAARNIDGPPVAESLRHNLLEYGELLLFLLSAMTYVNTLQERNVFAALRSWLVARRLTLRAIFWITGLMAFFLSPVLDNLTTALVMGAVVLSVGRGNVKFLVPALINVVVAANAGGAFSPFGDITTLMVWQKGVVTFGEFFALFLPALVNWAVPALCMHFGVPSGRPEAEAQRVPMKQGGWMVMLLFGITVALTVLLHHELGLPPFLGMMTGLSLLMIYGYFIRARETREFDIFSTMGLVEWDTLLFFYGVMLCVGGLGALGYLNLLSGVSYATLGATHSNVLVGFVSAVIDNIPVMFAVLRMDPDMSHGQWLLVTLTAGVGGSLLSIGSAAGVALMGQARGVYTFVSHLKWIWAVALGYAASIWVHFQVNASLF
jgi:Na+/H+ antiporter NhaD/arsenite permease-like protein